MNTIAVVGHGRTPVGRQWGGKIDACERVVRMWDCYWQDAADYGVKYDYGFFELSPKQMSRMKFYNKNTPTKGYIAALIKQRDYAIPPDTAVIASVWDWIQIGLDMGGMGEHGKLKLTRGCMAACWALDLAEPKPDQVILVGFDNVFTRRALTPQEGFPDAYINLPSTSWKTYVGGGTKYNNHDYIAEGRILKALARRHGIKLYHAQEIWA